MSRLILPDHFTHRYKTVGMYSPDQVLQYATAAHHTNHIFAAANLQKFKVDMKSLRYQCFQQSLRCACCGLEGKWMLLQFGASQLKKNKKVRPHFNLYAIENDIYVLMTKDHILPVSCGGTNDISNLQTMCSICNGIKSNRKDATFEDILQVRSLFWSDGPSAAYKALSSTKSIEESINEHTSCTVPECAGCAR